VSVQACKCHMGTSVDAPVATVMALGVAAPNTRAMSSFDNFLVSKKEIQRNLARTRAAYRSRRRREHELAGIGTAAEYPAIVLYYALALVSSQPPRLSLTHPHKMPQMIHMTSANTITAAEN
jgi:hypothetical protein